MRSTKWARWATCALALSICLPAVADHARTSKKSLSDCTMFDQNDKGDDAVEMSIHNSCSMPVDCTLQWKVVCAPKSQKRRAVHASSTVLSIGTGATQSTAASAAACGDDSWSIEGIEWSCKPNEE